MTLSDDEIRLIRSRNLSRRAEFLEMANAVCAEMDVTFAQVTGARGSPRVCEARSLICRIAEDRGFNHGIIARFIRRDRSTVSHAVAQTRKPPKGVD